MYVLLNVENKVKMMQGLVGPTVVFRLVQEDLLGYLPCFLVRGLHRSDFLLSWQWIREDKIN